MTTFITTTTASTDKDIKFAAMKSGYKHGNVKTVCPMCSTARCTALKFVKKNEVIYACSCGYRRKDVLDGNKQVIDKRNVIPAKKATKAKKASTRSKAKEMVNPGMPIDM